MRFWRQARRNMTNPRTVAALKDKAHLSPIEFIEIQQLSVLWLAIQGAASSAATPEAERMAGPQPRRYGSETKRQLRGRIPKGRTQTRAHGHEQKPVPGSAKAESAATSNPEPRRSLAKPARDDNESAGAGDQDCL
jgi:hypothetical protein